MASSISSFLHSIWPFSNQRSDDDLKASDKLVRRLKILEHTKAFVFALREPDSGAVVYLIAGQTLSKQSALDIEHLIKAIRPKAVVAQAASSSLVEIQSEEITLGEDQSNKVPTSAFEVFKACLIKKINKEECEKLAGCQILHAIFGVGFYGNLLAARRASEEVGSQFVLLESPYERSSSLAPSGEKLDGASQSSSLPLQPSSLLPGKVKPAIYLNLMRFRLTEELQPQVEALISSMDFMISESRISHTDLEATTSAAQPEDDYDGYLAPPFARSVYPLLEDLHNIFMNHPEIGRALASAQKMLLNVTNGEPVNSQLLSDAQNFQFTVEGLRIALNEAGRCPVERTKKGGSKGGLEFNDLTTEEKCHALSALAIKEQAKKHGTVVAIVDAATLGGLRRQWDVRVPMEFTELATNSDNGFSFEGDDLFDSVQRKKKPLADKPVVMVGAGATAVVGASSLSKALPASTLVKIATYKVPLSFKLGLANLQRAAAIQIGEVLGVTKTLVVGITSSGTKASALKFVASAEKIRALTHGMLASAKRTSLLAIRTSFYEIMRRRGAGLGPFQIVPWATFSCSVAAGAGLVMCGDAIENAADSIPSIPSIATLGRGLQSLRSASQELKRANTPSINDSLHSLINFSRGPKDNNIGTGAAGGNQSLQTYWAGATRASPAGSRVGPSRLPLKVGALSFAAAPYFSELLLTDGRRSPYR